MLFDLIKTINESKNISKINIIKCKYVFDGKKCNSNQKRSKEKLRCECKNPIKHLVCQKDYIWNSSTCAIENCEYLKSNVDD